METTPETENPNAARALDRIETLAKLIANQVADRAVYENGSDRINRTWLADIVEISARAAIADSPLRYPDELHIEPVPAPQYVDIVLDDAPGGGGMFAGIQDDAGRDLDIGVMLERPDGVIVVRLATIVTGPFYETQRPSSAEPTKSNTASTVAPTDVEANLLHLVGGLTISPDITQAHAESVARAAGQVVMDARFVRAMAVLGREIITMPSTDAVRLVSEDELYKAAAIVTAFLGRKGVGQMTAPHPDGSRPYDGMTLDAEASDLLARAYADRMSTLIDMVNLWVGRMAAADRLLCAHCGKLFDGDAMRAHAEECSMSRLVIELREAKAAHASAAELVATLYHAATGRRWGDGPVRGVVEDVEAVAALVDGAWGVIANAGGGDWLRESPEWRDAAASWRAEFVRINVERTFRGASSPVPLPHSLARQIFDAYGDEAGWVTYDGKTMPQWDDVGDVVRSRWAAAASKAIDVLRHGADLQLAAVLTAADGWPGDIAAAPRPGDPSWSEAFVRVHELRRCFDAARSLRSALDNAFDVVDQTRRDGEHSANVKQHLARTQAGLERIRAALMTERDRVQLHAELVAGGLSDSEARGTAWPEEIFGGQPVAPTSAFRHGDLLTVRGEALTDADTVHAAETVAISKAAGHVVDDPYPDGYISTRIPPARAMRPFGGGTHTLALMAVSLAAFTEVKGNLQAAGYDHAIHPSRDGESEDERLDMSGIALVPVR